MDYRQWLVQAHHAAAQDFDKAVTVLAGGALALSITFIHDIAPNPTHEGWLGTGWGFFAGALLATFLSYLASQAAILKRIEEYDRQEWGFNWAGVLTTALNGVAAIGVVAGFVCLVVFALHNL